MKDEELERALVSAAGDAARERERDAAWEALAAGSLDDDARRQLEAKAAANDGDAADDGHARAMLDASRPLGAAFEGRVLARIANERREAANRAGAERRARFVRIAAPLALAAGMALFLSRSIHQGAKDDPPIPRGAAYTLSISGDAKDHRGADVALAGGPFRFAPEAAVSIVLRPATDFAGVLAARAFLVRARDGGVEPWSAPLAFSAAGTARLAGTSRELFGGRHGSFELVIALGRPNAVPDGPRAFEASPAAGARVELFRAPIELMAP